ncbi:Interleukin-12 receptor subunit beta-2 [Collichthys lucidus]|uniref:Interleukin-12 receptor subunit beta-2 n=1 Tax=Collichthys lucidus TaxID=240159 RepID=A0A4U5UKI9_COLLU|nr:Interleukin-12 receptor subunit beta-2 [Collichthys lucidus]
MSQTWSIITAFTVLAVQLCTGEKSCDIWSSAGPVVQRGSSFEVYCTFNCKCKGAMYSYHPPIPQTHKEFNSTTLFLSVSKIAKNRTFSCQCSCPALDPCGQDISAGYPPESPKNIQCIYEVLNNESGVVFCTWKRGRETFLWNSSVLRVTTIPGNHTVGPVTASSKGTNELTASFSVSSSVQQISVQVQAHNALGSAWSMIHNYTLSDIATPSTPELGQPECSSRECVIQVTQSVSTEHLEIQYREEAQTWTSYPDSGAQMSLVQDRSISSLEPYRLYHFRARSRFNTGSWSQWSANVSSWTQEEAPAKELDVWYAEPASDSKSLIVYWKEPNISISRGKITGYKLEVYNLSSVSVFSTNVSADVRSHPVQFCADCEVTVWSCNSKGLSPPARITTRHTKAKPLEVKHKPADNHSVTISWRKPETAPGHAAYVVELYPEGYKLEELRWVRVSRKDTRTVITGIKPFECYEGAVYVVYNESSVSRTRFTCVTTLESAPAAGPLAQEEVEGNKVKVTWTEILRAQRGGCITSYTIYLDNGSGDEQRYSIPGSETSHIITDLSPAVYNLWMTASTAAGRRSCTSEAQVLHPGFCMFFQCLMLSDVPDPANSKWAKECTQEKGKMNLQLQHSNSTVTEEEEEPILVDVEELPKQSSDPHAPPDDSSQSPPQTSPSPMSTLLYPALTTYIKSYSHDSDSSDQTQTSLDTTIDYISSHGMGNLDEEDQEDEEEFTGMLGFFPSNIVLDSLSFGGKLTLDAVKIDCNDFFQNDSF